MALQSTEDVVSLFGCFSEKVFLWASILLITSFLADVKVAVKNKVPLVRSLTLSWVTFCIETSNKAAILKVHKEYVPICMEVSSTLCFSQTCSFILILILFNKFLVLPNMILNLQMTENLIG